MGTRGLCGFRKDNTDKLTYNHFDSYPEYLGENIAKFICSTPIDEMYTIFDRITLIDGYSIPTPEQIKYCREFEDLGVANESENNWYCLLRNAQGDLDIYKKGLKYMIDNHDFIKDSLFCEWAYIINLDAKRLEVYKGFQKRNQNNRYKLSTAEIKELKNGGGSLYYNCKLIVEYNLDEIPKDFSEDVNARLINTRKKRTRIA